MCSFILLRLAVFVPLSLVYNMSDYSMIQVAPFDYFFLPWMCKHFHVSAGWFFCSPQLPAISCCTCHMKKPSPANLMLFQSAVLQQATNKRIIIEHIEESPFFLIPRCAIEKFMFYGMEWWDFNKDTGHWDIYGLCSLGLLRPGEFHTVRHLPPPTQTGIFRHTRLSSQHASSSLPSVSSSSSCSFSSSSPLAPSFSISAWKSPPSLPSPFSCLTDTWFNDKVIVRGSLLEDRSLDARYLYDERNEPCINFVRWGKHYPWTKAEQKIRDKQRTLIAARTESGRYAGESLVAQLRLFSDMGRLKHNGFAYNTIVDNLFRINKPPNICFCEQDNYRLCEDAKCRCYNEVEYQVRWPKTAANYTHAIILESESFVVVYNAQHLDSLRLKDETDDARCNIVRCIFATRSSSSSASQSASSSSSASSASQALRSSFSSPTSSYSSSPPCMSSP